MNYNIIYEKRCLKYLKKLDRNMQLRIIKAINKLPLGDVKRLQGNTEDYRLRILHNSKTMFFETAIWSYHIITGKIYEVIMSSGLTKARFS